MSFPAANQVDTPDDSASLRVLHIVSTMKTGGLERQVLNLITASPKSRTFLVCVQEGGYFADQLESLGYKVLVLNGSSGIRKLVSLVSIIRRIQPHIIHCHNLLAFLYGKLASLCTLRGKTVISKHGEAFPDKSFSQKLALYFLKYTDVIVVSEAIRDKAMDSLNLNPRRITFIQNGIPVPVLHDDNDRENKNIIIGTVGRLVVEKRYDLLISSIAELRAVKADIKLVIVGAGYEQEALKRQSEELNLQDVVEFTGEQHDVSRFLRSMDIFVLTSDTEGLPMAMLEAMGFGIPVLSTKVGAIGELFTDNENILLVERGNESEIVEGLSRLIEDGELRDRLGSAGRELVKAEYSVQKSLQLHEELYQKLLAE